MGKGFVHFRAPQDLIDELQRLVDESTARGVPATISSVARIVIRKGLEQDPAGAEVQEVLAIIWQVTTRAMNRMKQTAKDSLPEYMQEALDELNGD